MDKEEWERRRVAMLQRCESVAATSGRQKEQLVVNRMRLEDIEKNLLQLGFVTGITNEVLLLYIARALAKLIPWLSCRPIYQSFLKILSGLPDLYVSSLACIAESGVYANKTMLEGTYSR